MPKSQGNFLSLPWYNLILQQKSKFPLSFNQGDNQNWMSGTWPDSQGVLKSCYLGVTQGMTLSWNSCYQGFPDSSVDKESSYNAGYPCLNPGLGGSTGEGIGYPLQYSWASLVAQLGKNLPAIQETWVLSLDWEDPLEKGKATHSSILAWRIPWTV